jgi:hypothetical protein
MKGGVEKKRPEPLLLRLQELARRESLARSQPAEDVEPPIASKPARTAIGQSPPVQVFDAGQFPVPSVI